VGIVGAGEFARDHHIPAILANPDDHLAAVCSRHIDVPRVRNFKSIEEMPSRAEHLDAVSTRTPPQAHHERAKIAQAHGKHVLLDKPPCTTPSRLGRRIDLARYHGVALYQIRHSQHAPFVESPR
jgi:D-galactose 1-dehydrogenase